MKAVYSIIGIAFLLTTSCDVKSLLKDKIVKDKDNRFQMSVPFLWEEMSDLHDDAEIQVAYTRNELYCIVLVESKDDFDEMDLENYSDITRQSIMENLKNGEQSKLTDIEINKMPAMQCTISGAMDNLKLVYIHTAVETEKYFLQIITWTLKSYFDKYRPELEKVISSFEVIEGKPEASKQDVETKNG